MNDFTFLSEKPIYTHTISFDTCYPEVAFTYSVQTHVESRDNIQFSCMCMGNMDGIQFSEEVLDVVTQNIRNHMDVINAELIDVEHL